MVKVIDQVTGALSRLGVQANYGEKVEVGGVELVPVSLVWMGFGGGQDAGGADSGASASGDQASGDQASGAQDRGGAAEASGGGGGGGASIPVGAYVPGLDGPEFRPNLVTLVVVSTFAIWASGHALSRVIKAFR